MYTKEISYDRETRDFACYLNGELVGFARTYQEGDTLLDDLVHELTNRHGVVPAAEAAELALDARAVLADEQADAELNRRENELAARCSCFRGALLNGDNERPACVAAGYCLDEAEQAARNAQAQAEPDENPYWTACREAFGREPKAYEFIIWIQMQHREFYGSDRAALTDAEAAVFTAWLQGRNEKQAQAEPAYARHGGDVYVVGGRWYCTLASWPYSPAARGGAMLANK